MMQKFRNYRQIRDIEIDNRTHLATLTDMQKREMIPVAVIDDESFSPEQNLVNNGYVIEILGDIRSLQDISSFNVILCDLQGVGRHLNSKSQGAYIIDEIKRNHPEKFVIAYTGGASDDQITLLAQRRADYFIKKDADIEEWRDKLDEILSFLTDPIAVWKRQRIALTSADVPTLDILHLEDAFVNALISKDSDRYTNLIRSYSGDLRSIANSLVASGLIKMFTGAS